jgi:hypothetical protein
MYCTVLVRGKPCQYSLPARDKSQSVRVKGEGRGRWPDSCAQQSQVLQGGRDLRWANGRRAGKPCRLFPAHIFGSRPLGSRGGRPHAKQGLARAFPGPNPISMLDLAAGLCWPLLACPPSTLRSRHLDISTIHNRPRSQQQKSTVSLLLDGC